MKHILLISLIFFGLNSDAQKVQPLNIGDKVPDLQFRNVLNYKTKTARLSDFKGQLILLDMWSVFCPSCITAMPKMEALQKKYAGKLQVLLVNPENDEHNTEPKLLNVLKKLEKQTGVFPSLPIPIADTVLKQYFPFKSVPHHVWISAEGKLLAVTSAQEVDEHNIEWALTGKPLPFAVKDRTIINRQKPMFIPGNGPQEYEVVYRSMFTKYLGIGMDSRTRTNNKGEVIGVSLRDFSLMMFAKQAYPDIITHEMSRSRVLAEVKNPEMFKWETGTFYRYCYDVIVPPTARADFKIEEYLQQDLKRVFNISVHKEKRRLRSWVLRTTPALMAHVSKDTIVMNQIVPHSIKNYFRGYSVADIAGHFEARYMRFIDETNLTQRFDLSFPDYFDLNDEQAVVAFLRRAGFDIKEEEREIDVVVITDK